MGTIFHSVTVISLISLISLIQAGRRLQGGRIYQNLPNLPENREGREIGKLISLVENPSECVLGKLGRKGRFCIYEQSRIHHGVEVKEKNQNYVFESRR